MGPYLAPRSISGVNPLTSLSTSCPMGKGERQEKPGKWVFQQRAHQYISQACELEALRAPKGFKGNGERGWVFTHELDHHSYLLSQIQNKISAQQSKFLSSWVAGPDLNIISPSVFSSPIEDFDL